MGPQSFNSSTMVDSDLSAIISRIPGLEWGPSQYNIYVYLFWYHSFTQLRKHFIWRREHMPSIYPKQHTGGYSIIAPSDQKTRYYWGQVVWSRQKLTSRAGAFRCPTYLGFFIHLPRDSRIILGCSEGGPLPDDIIALFDEAWIKGMAQMPYYASMWAWFMTLAISY